MDELQRRVARNIKRLAKERGITLTHVPDRGGLSRTHFYDVLAGRKWPTLKWLRDVAHVLNADVEEIVRR